MKHFFPISALVFYILSAGCFLWQVIRGHESVARIARVLFGFGFICHTAALLALFGVLGTVFLDNGADYFFWASWAFALALFLLKRRLDFPIVGALAVPLVVLFMGSSSYLLHASQGAVVTEGQADLTQTILLGFHAVPALIVVVSLALALIVSVVFLIVERRLKNRGAAALSLRGPSLQTLDRINKWAVLTGFVGISLVVLSGSLWAVSAGRPFLTADASILTGLMVWFLLALVLHLRVGRQWSARKVSLMTAVVTGLFFTSIFMVMLYAGRLTHSNLLS